MNRPRPTANQNKLPSVSHESPTGLFYFLSFQQQVLETKSPSRNRQASPGINIILERGNRPIFPMCNMQHRPNDASQQTPEGWKPREPYKTRQFGLMQTWLGTIPVITILPEPTGTHPNSLPGNGLPPVKVKVKVDSRRVG